MHKKSIVLIVVVALILIGVMGYVLVKKNIFSDKYSINGSVSQCVLNGKTVYQFIEYKNYAMPRHFTATGNPISCDFEGRIPSANCQTLLTSLKGCRIIYRTDKNPRGMAGIYTAEAVQAMPVLKGKIR